MSELTRLMVGPNHPEDNARFGDLMMFFRNERGLNRAEAADAIGVSSEFVRSIEGHFRTPAAKTAESMLRTYEVPFERQVDGNQLILIFHGHHVKFTSRIQERRTNDAKPQTINRNELVGRIVSLLSIADDSTLQYIHQKLAGG